MFSQQELFVFAVVVDFHTMLSGGALILLI